MPDEDAKKQDSHAEEENKISATASAIKGVLEAVPIYDDALQPAAKQVGTALETVGKTINVLLSPLEAVVWGYQQFKELFVPSLAEKLKNVAKERLISPNLRVAGPLVEGLRFTGHDPTLREMYVKLLATAMDRETAQKAHPAFVDIIRHLTPDEGRVLQWLSKKKNVQMESRTWSRIKMIDEYIARPAAVEHPDLIASSLDNLARLGLLKDQEFRLADFDSPAAPPLQINIDLTDFGAQFCVACMD